MTVFHEGTLIWQRFTNVSCLRNILQEKRRDSFDLKRESLLGKNSICMVNLLGTSPVIVFVFSLHDCLASVFSEEKFCFVKRA